MTDALTFERPIENQHRTAQSSAEILLYSKNHNYDTLAPNSSMGGGGGGELIISDILTGLDCIRNVHIISVFIVKRSKFRVGYYVRIFPLLL